jgi:hypothetical protein
LAVAPHRSDALDEAAAAHGLVEREEVRADVAALSGLVCSNGSSPARDWGDGDEDASRPNPPEWFPVICRNCTTLYVRLAHRSVLGQPECPTCGFVGWTSLRLPPPRYEHASELRAAFVRVGHSLGMCLPEAALAARTEVWTA